MSKSSKRGVSLEEKREKMLAIFYETRSFYQLKDLEKLGPKKGVISQSVKDVVQNLVDDDLVLKDKIGTSVYFWSLPSRAGNQLRQVRTTLNEELEKADTRQTVLQNRLELAKKGREESEERKAVLTVFKKLREEQKALQEELDLYTHNDPQLFKAMKTCTKVAHGAVNRWTDNVFLLQKWCSKNFPEAEEALQQMYTEVGISEDFDWLEPQLALTSRLTHCTQPLSFLVIPTREKSFRLSLLPPSSLIRRQ